MHAVDWWVKLWEKTGLVNIACAEVLPAADLIRQEYIRDYEEKNETDPFAEALKKDKDGFVSFFRLVAQRTHKDAYLQSYKENGESDG